MAEVKKRKLNKEQKMAATWCDGPLLIVAGAGTGKTTVITERIAELIKTKKAKPEEILGLTFTEKAAEEMADRVEEIFPDNYSEFWISTFHSFCERVLKNYGLDIGLSTNFRLLDQVGSWLLIRQNLDKFDLDYYKPLGNPTKFIQSLLNHFSRCKDEGIAPEQYLKYSEDLQFNTNDAPVGSKAIKSKDKSELACLQDERDRIKEIANAYHTYQRLLLENNCLDFADLINYCLKLFQQRPLILEKFRKQFKYILVDEFQDTNWAQYELVKQIAEPKNNIMVCGDDDQSVYRWRGASFNNVLQFRKDFPKAKEIVLTENYRSCQNILDLSYKFIQFNNPNRLEYQLNKVKEISQSAREKGVDLTEFKKIDKRLKAAKTDKAVIEHLFFDTKELEFDGVANKILELKSKSQDIAFNDFAILCRTNEAANMFSRAMERANIPYQFLSSKGLYSKPIVLDIISYLKLLDNYFESSAVYRVLNIPCFKVAYDDIVRINQYSRRKARSMYEAMEELPLIQGISQQGQQKISSILGLLKKHSAAAQKKNISEIFVEFLQDSGYLEHLTKEKKPEKMKENLDLINQFYDRIKRFEDEQTDPKLNLFIQQIDMELESGEEGSLKFNPELGEETVKIMTIHSAKGLEFKYVFLVNLVDKRFPTIERKEPIEIPEPLVKEVAPEGDIHLQEERRLFYVAMTRAKKGLFFTSAKDYGQARLKKPSRFLMEAGIIDKSQVPMASILKISQIPARNASPAKRSDAGGQIPDHFSYSQLANFEKCPLQYKFAHILKIPVKGKAVFTYGTTMHNTLYDFINRVMKSENSSQNQLFAPAQSNQNQYYENGSRTIGFEELMEIYKNNWKDEWFENEEEKQKYYKLGKDSLKIFYDNFIKTNPKIKTIQGIPVLEKSFKLKIGGSTFVGKIDRIDDTGKSVEIIDYKTGKSKTKLKPEEKEQLLIYQIAAEKVFGLRVEKLSYYYLNDGSIVSFIGIEKGKQEIEEKIKNMVEKIKQSDFQPTPNPFHCKYCDFRNICEFRKL